MQTENTYVETDLGNIAFNPRGEYSDETSYEYLDTVSYKGGSYVCLAELAKTTSGIAPEPGKNTEHWQMLTLPGGLTSDYIAMHDDVVNKAKQIETSRAAVELSQQEVEAAQTDVSQMRQDTQDASQMAIASRDSAAGYAQSAEISRTAAKESEDNVKAQESKVVQSVIEEGTKQIKAVSNKAMEQIGAVNTAGSKQVSTIETEGADQVKAIQEAGKNALQNISNGVDKGLSEEGKAADAKATGEAISKLTEDLGEKETKLTDIQKKMSDSNSNDGFLLCDLNGNIVGHIASFEVWNNEPYNKKYGWGGHPYGNGKLPPYSKVAGVFEADLLSVRGGKGRWNKDDTGNFQHGGHLFEGWNAEEDARLTFGIGTKNKDISWIQTFHAATQEGTDSGSYYCVTKVGSDIDNQGVNFMPSITQSRSLFSLKVGDNLSPNSKHIQKLVETGELVDWEYNKTDMIPYGTMYFDYTNDKVRVYTRTDGWKYLKFEEEEA